jgi:hypothetical protein
VLDPWRTLEDPERPWILRGCSKGTHGHARVWASGRPRKFATTVHQPAFPPSRSRPRRVQGLGKAWAWKFSIPMLRPRLWRSRPLRERMNDPFGGHCSCSRQYVVRTNSSSGAAYKNCLVCLQIAVWYLWNKTILGTDTFPRLSIPYRYN